MDVVLFYVAALEFGFGLLQTFSGRLPQTFPLFLIAFAGTAFAGTGFGILPTLSLIMYLACWIPRFGDYLVHYQLSPLRLSRRWTFGRQLELAMRRLLSGEHGYAIETQDRWLVTSAACIALAAPSLLTGGLFLFLLHPRVRIEWLGHREISPVMRGVALAFIPLVISTAFSVIVGTRWVDAEHPIELVQQLVAIQLVFGVIPLTVLVFVAQLAVNAYGPRAYTVLPFRRLSLGLFATVVSISADAYYLGARTIPSGIPELLELLAAAATTAAATAGLILVQGLNPAAVMTALVGRLGLDWLDHVERIYENEYQPAPPGFVDHFGDIERALYISATRDSDSRRFRGVLRLLIDRLDYLAELRDRPRRVGAPAPFEAEIAAHYRIRRSRLHAAIDDYLAERLRPLVIDLAREHKVWALESIVDFKRQLEQTAVCTRPHDPGSAPADLQRESFDKPPSGLQLYGQVLQAALDHALVDVARHTLVGISQCAQKVLSQLPDPSGMWDVDPAAEVRYLPDHPAQVTAHGIEAYVDWLTDCAEKARDKRLSDVLSSIAFDLRFFKDYAVDVTDTRWADWIIRRTGLATFLVADKGRSLGVLAYRPPSHMREFAADKPGDVSYVETEAYWLPAILTANVDLLSPMTIIESSLFAFYALPAFLEPAASVTGVLEAIAEKLPALPQVAERRAVAREIVSRLAQIRTRPHDPAVFEPRVEEWKTRWAADMV